MTSTDRFMLLFSLVSIVLFHSFCEVTASMKAESEPRRAERVGSGVRSSMHQEKENQSEGPKQF